MGSAGPHRGRRGGRGGHRGVALARSPTAPSGPRGAAYLVWGAVAGLHAWGNVLRGEVHPVWDPTRRGPVPR